MTERHNRPAVRAVIFDLDGVLVSTDEQHYLSWKHVADDEGIYYDRQIGIECRGASRMESLAVVLRNAKREYNDDEKAELADRKNRYYLELIEGLGPHDLLPRVRELLRELKKRGIKIAVASGSRNAVHILERCGIGGMFDAIVSRLDFTRSKPHPDAFVITAQRLGIAPEECIVVEDAPVGVEAALRCRMRALGVSREHPLPGAARTVGSLSDVTADELLSL